MKITLAIYGLLTLLLQLTLSWTPVSTVNIWIGDSPGTEIRGNQESLTIPDTGNGLNTPSGNQRETGNMSKETGRTSEPADDETGATGQQSSDITKNKDVRGYW